MWRCEWDILQMLWIVDSFTCYIKWIEWNWMPNQNRTRWNIAAGQWCKDAGDWHRNAPGPMDGDNKTSVTGRESGRILRNLVCKCLQAQFIQFGQSVSKHLESETWPKRRNSPQRSLVFLGAAGPLPTIQRCFSLSLGHAALASKMFKD